VGHQHPAALRRLPDHPRAVGDIVRRVPEAVRGGAAAGGGEGVAPGTSCVAIEFSASGLC
jgi:hypothetical protein